MYMYVHELYDGATKGTNSKLWRLMHIKCKTVTEYAVVSGDVSPLNSVSGFLYLSEKNVHVYSRTCGFKVV